MCLGPNCNRKPTARQMCTGHYKQWQRGDQLSALRPRVKNGAGRYKNAEGYIFVYAVGTKRRIFEHRKVMETYLGRALLEFENVHHKNGIRDDNRIENLELWSTAQPSGQRVVDKLNWAREIIKLYGSLDTV